jgi:uncharacterized membrane protein YdcZ (DUF606 family)
MWYHWVIGIVGLAIVLVGLLGISGIALTSTLIVAGFIVAALGFAAAGATEDRIERMRNPYADSVFQ